MNFSESNQVIVDSVHNEIADKRTDILNHRSLYARKAFRPGETITEFHWEKVHAKPSYLTVQISDNQHIELMPDYLECVNHSCDPNSFFDTASRHFIALKPIQEGDEFTFFYPSTEWDMDQAFKCRCGTDQCIGKIRGAKYLDEKAVRKYRFTDFIKSKLGR